MFGEFAARARGHLDESMSARSRSTWTLEDNGSAVPRDAQIAIVAAVVAFLPAWFTTRRLDARRPGWGVRVYRGIFRVSLIGRPLDRLSNRQGFPAREAFLAAWFLCFFLIFAIGVFVWPGAGEK